MSPTFRPGPEWPRVLCPAPGCAMPTAPLERRERVLHISLRNSGELQAPLSQAFGKIATVYRIVDTQIGYTQAVAESILYEAAQIAPTLVWFQAQHEPDWLTDDLVPRLRVACARNAVFINWDGDQHHEPRHPRREWFVRFGRQLDASLVKNTRHPYEYAALGVVRPGYLGEGYDANVLADLAPPADCPEVAFVGNQNPMPGYDHRNAILGHLVARLGGRLGIYGSGWTEPGWNAARRDRIPFAAAGGVYAGAKASLSLSIRDDLPRYTSNRLVNILAAGGVALVERFPDCEALDLVDGANCLIWAGLAELDRAVDRALAMSDAERAALRVAARAAAVAQSWDVYMAHLLAIVDLVRAAKGLPRC